MTRPGDEYMVPSGNFLGQMTDEIAKDFGEKARIVEFVSTGAKCYGLKIDIGDGTIRYIVKSKGFELNYETGQRINMQTMVDMVQKKGEPSINITGTGIRRTADHQLTTRTVKKTLRLTVDKRIVLSNNQTKPFGMKKN